jgi:hypothetical protein
VRALVSRSAHGSPGASAEVRRTLFAPRVQTKLEIGRADDEYEREADRVAEQVTRGGSAAGPARLRLRRYLF